MPNNMENKVAQVVPVTGTFTKMYCVAPGAAGDNDGPILVTLDKNGAATGLTCTFAGGAGTCGPGSGTATVNPGDTLDISVSADPHGPMSCGIAP